MDLFIEMNEESKAELINEAVNLNRLENFKYMYVGDNRSAWYISSALEDYVKDNETKSPSNSLMEDYIDSIVLDNVRDIIDMNKNYQYSRKEYLTMKKEWNNR